MRIGRRLLAVGAVGALGGALLTAVTPAQQQALAQPPPTAAALADRAARAATSAVASRPTALRISAKDRFAQDRVITSGSARLVPYTRTHSGLPVVGGDFVVVGSTGKVTYTSTALKYPIGDLAVTPSWPAAGPRRSPASSSARSPAPRHPGSSCTPSARLRG